MRCIFVQRSDIMPSSGSLHQELREFFTFISPIHTPLRRLSAVKEQSVQYLILDSSQVSSYGFPRRASGAASLDSQRRHHRFSNLCK